MIEVCVSLVRRRSSEPFHFINPSGLSLSCFAQFQPTCASEGMMSVREFLSCMGTLMVSMS